MKNVGGKINLRLIIKMTEQRMLAKVNIFKRINATAKNVDCCEMR